MQKLYNETSVENIAEAIRENNGTLLPKEYQEVEYIESTGTQYIDTNYVPNRNDSIYIEVYPIDDKPFWGTINFTTARATDVDYFRIFQSSGVMSGTLKLNEWQIGFYDNKTQIFSMHNNTVIAGNEDAINSLWLFGRRDNQVTGKSRIRKFIVENKLNFIPCYRKSDNVIGLYDLVENKFYTNAGTGEFLKGADVLSKFKISEMPIGINNIADNLKSYIPKATTEEKQFKAIPLSVNQKVFGNVEQNGESTPDNPQEVKTLRGVNWFDEKFINSNQFLSPFPTRLARTVYVPENRKVECSTNLDMSIYNWAITQPKYPYPTPASTQVIYSDSGWLTNKQYTIEASDRKGYYVNITIRRLDGQNISPEEMNNYDFQISFENQPYTPYGYLREEFVGKNLAYDGWAEDFVNRIDNKLQAEILNVDNRRVLKLGVSAGYGSYDTKYMFKINWKENTSYSFKMDLLNDNTSERTRLTIHYTDGTTQNVGSTKTYNVWNPISFQSNANKTIKYITPNYISGFIEIDLDTFMVYEGTDDLPYEPYKSTSQLIYIGDNELLEDDFVEVDEKGNTKITKGWGKVVLDGSEEGWTMSTHPPTDTKYFSLRKNVFPNVIGIENRILCTHAKNRKNPYAEDIENTVIIVFSDLRMRLNKNIDNLDDWKLYLKQQYDSGTPVTVYYPLETSTEIDLGKHDKLIPLEGTNNISILATLEPSKITTTHYYDYRI